VAAARPLLVREGDRLLLRSGPKGSPFVAVGVQGLGPINAHRPLVVWDDVHDFELAGGLPRGRLRRGAGILVTLLATRPDDDSRLDDPAFPDRIVARWVLTRRDEPKTAGLGYVPRGVGDVELAHALDLIRAIARAGTSEDRARLIASVAER
jgi:hypothetical protein